MGVRIEISPGELVDRITILEIKKDRMRDEAKLKNVRQELEMLVADRDKAFASSGRIAELSDELRKVNEQLWVVEDDIRDCERQKDFGEGFIRLARSVYRLNDQRASLKKQLNLLLDSSIMEEKSYAPY